MWTTKEDFDESGPAIVHRKCFGVDIAEPPPPPPSAPPTALPSSSHTDERGSQGAADKIVAEANKENKVVATKAQTTTNSVVVKVGSLATCPARNQGGLVRCEGCDAVLIVSGGSTSVGAPCVFCKAASPADLPCSPPLQRPREVREVFVLTPPATAEEESLAPAAETPLLVMCIDISGSMQQKISAAASTTRLEAIKGAAIAQIKEAAKTGATDITVVTFEGTVTILNGCGNGGGTCFSGRALNDAEHLFGKGEGLATVPTPAHSGTNYERLIANVAALKARARK